MSNKIKTAIRVRPFVSSEKKQQYRNSFIEVNQQKKEISVKQNSSSVRKFHFDHLFSEQDSQQDVYNTCQIDRMIDKALEGYHSTIFAYGQTGSGKTHTMQGSESMEDGQVDGIIPKVIGSMFNKINGLKHKRTFLVSVSFLQIYNEKIFDLLNPTSLNNKNLSSANVNGLRLRWNKDEQFSVENLFVFECKTQEELNKFFIYGLKNRISSAHRLNVQSSRSHSILTIRLESFSNDDPSHTIFSKLELVDLAGSERIGSTGTEGRQAKESIDINKSLFTLRQVISILAEAGKQGAKGKEKSHVPYRDSKLTSILKQSIGGNSYSLMIACINPNDSFLEENLSTLTYATKASYITNQPVVNDDPRSKLIAQLKKQVRMLNEELGKANEHIELISHLEGAPGAVPKNQKMSSTGATVGRIRSNKQECAVEQNEAESENENDMPVPVFKKGVSDKVNSNYENFSERLVESINMVRELLKGNKDLREQLETNSRLLQEKNLEIYELTRENEMLRENKQLNFPGSTSEFQRTTNQGGFGTGSDFENNVPIYTTTGNSKAFEIPIFNDHEVPSKDVKFHPRATMGSTHSNNIYGVGQPHSKGSKGAMSQSKGNFNYWNSVEINQFYMNERGVDSMPTNFNKREINTAQDRRASTNSRGRSSESTHRHAITAKMSTRRNWMSKNSEPKRFISFYNGSNTESPQKQRDCF